MAMENLLQTLKNQEEKAKLGEGQKAIDKQHSDGKLTARERVDLFFDKGSFVELDMFAQHSCHEFGMEKRRPYGDGVVTGFGKVNGRTIYVYAQDFTVLGGTVGVTHAEKICNLMRMARKAQAPIVGLVDSGGGRIQEGTGTYSFIFSENILSSGVVPQISAIMGNCAGGGVYSPALTDFIFMVEGTSQMFITGPAVLKQVTGEEITMQELGGAKTHSTVSGVCDFVSKNDQECLDQIKKLLTYLPDSYRSPRVRVETGDDPNRTDDELMGIIPDNPRGAYDMRNIIKKVVDNGEFVEAKPAFAKSLITGFARLNGWNIGIVANNPMFLAGSLDCDASDKAGRFYRTCDCFNIPIITFVDVPGYLPGTKEEFKGIIRHGAKMLYGFREATVPKIVCVTRKGYGGAQVAMGTKSMGADIMMAWPTAEIAIMGADGAVPLLYKKELDEAPDKDAKDAVRSQKIQEYRDTFNTPYYAAGRQLIDIIIKPQETRPQLIKALELLKDKVEEFPARKHGNIPL